MNWKILAARVALFAIRKLYLWAEKKVSKPSWPEDG